MSRRNVIVYPYNFPTGDPSARVILEWTLVDADNAPTDGYRQEDNEGVIGSHVTIVEGNPDAETPEAYVVPLTPTTELLGATKWRLVVNYRGEEIRTAYVTLGAGDDLTLPEFLALDPAPGYWDIISNRLLPDPTSEDDGAYALAIVSGEVTGYAPAAAGSGDVAGPETSTDGAIALFDGTTGKLIKDGPMPTPAGIGAATLEYVDVNEEQDIDVEKIGFLPGHDLSISFDDSTWTFTLASAGGAWSYYRAGIKQTVNGDRSIVLGSPPADGTWYIWIDANDGTLTASQTPWTLGPGTTNVIVAYIEIRSSSTPKYQLYNELHLCDINRGTHAYLHFTQGAQYKDGGTLTDYVLEGTTDANNQFVITQGMFFDETLRITVSAVAAGGPYLCRYYDGVTWQWEQTTLPYRVGTTYLLGYDDTGDVEAISTEFVVNYVVMTSAGYQILPGNVHSDLTGAESEVFGSLDYSALALAEFVGVEKLIWHCKVNISTTGKAELISVEQIRVNSIPAGTGAVVAHAASHAKDGSDPVSPESIGALANLVDDTTPELGGNLSTNGKWISGDGDSEGLFINADGDVGIGTDSSVAKLESFGTTEQLRLSYDSSNYISFEVGSTGKATIAPTGTDSNIAIISEKIGFNTTDPFTPLHVNATTDASSGVLADQSMSLHHVSNSVAGDQKSIAFGQSADPARYGARIAFETSGSSSRGHFKFYTKDSIAGVGPNNLSFVIQDNGDVYVPIGAVGIGSTAPQNKLDVAGGQVIGASYAGVETAPADGLLTEGAIETHDAYYLGPADTNGSWRVVQNGANLEFQQRVAGVWVAKNTITGE